MNMAKALFEHGANVNELSTRGLAPLHAAVVRNRADAVKWLLENGANPYIENYIDGASAMDYADMSRDMKVVKAFRDCGYDLSLRMQGTGLWVVAAFMNHAEENNTRRRFIGQMMFVTAGCDMKAGTELTTNYGQADELRQWKL